VGFSFLKKYNMNKKMVSTLMVEDIRPGRGSGNSIRQVDYAIDKLYEGYVVKVQDHFVNGADKRANQYLFDRIIKRLEFEHNLRYLFATDKVRLDKHKLEIEFL
jgi:hypothetical protein